jgi:uncharacterized protein (DUF952 family)
VQTLFHIARRRDWDQAQRDGAYRISTLGRTLDQQGYIHLSLPGQVKRVAEAFYADVDDELVLLAIDPAKLVAPVATESSPGTDEQFPHLYGELPIDAVRRVIPYAADGQGRFPPAPVDNRVDEIDARARGASSGLALGGDCPL